jgi:DNA-directed RNA polymerase specialized sigma24 family protein
MNAEQGGQGRGAGDPGDLRRELRLLVSNRHSVEARALFEVLTRYAHRRVSVVNRHCGNVLSEGEQEEVVGEVLLQLMQGSLAAFRGETLPELLGFVRTISDRTTWRAIRRRDRERSLLQADGELVGDWTASLPRPDAHLETVPDSPLPEADQSYLRDLLQAGSKAEYARRAGVSRAAVTQRVQRIRSRVAELAPGARMAHEVWMNQAARRVLESEVDLPELADADG